MSATEGGGFKVYRLMAKLGHEPLIADMHRLALITRSLSKDGRSDAAVLAGLGLRMPEMLNAVQPCSLETQVNRSLLAGTRGRGRDAYEADQPGAAPWKGSKST